MPASLTLDRARARTFRVIKRLRTSAGDHIARSSQGLPRDELSGLMARSQAGDKQAYRRVLTACVPLAADAARRAGVQEAAVHDVVQDVLLAVHRARPTYDPSRPVGPWLHAIARQCATDVLRSHAAGPPTPRPPTPKHSPRSRKTNQP